MKIRSLLPILVLAAQTTTATIFKLPKDAPLFSIAMPDNWLTEEKGDVITSRPEKDSKTVVSVFPVPAAKDLQDALNMVSKQVASQYQDYSVGEPAEEKEAGMMFRMTEAKGKRDGAEIRILLFTFSPDDQRYFGVTQTVAGPNSVEKYGRALDGVMTSIRSFKEEARKAKEAHDKATSVVPFPKEKPAITLEVVNTFVVDATAERLIIKSKKERRTAFQVGFVPASDGVVDEASAKAWLPKKAEALLKALDAEDQHSFGVQDYFSNIAGHKAFEVKYSFGAMDTLEVWVFTPDGQRYFYAYFHENDEDFEEMKEAEPLGWGSNLVSSIEAAK